MLRSKIQKKIDLALTAICDVYNVSQKDVLNPSRRKQPIPDARRMLIHYAHYQLKIKHYHMKKYIPPISHATSIYHCNKLDVYLKVEKDTRDRYMIFRKKAGQFDDMLYELNIKKEEIKELNKEINHLIKELIKKNNHAEGLRGNNI